MEDIKFMRCFLKYMKTMCWAVVVPALMASCDDDDKATSGFGVDQTEMQFANDGGVLEVKVSTDCVWTAETENDWCMVSPATGTGNGICVIKADSSYLYKERTGRVIFYSDKGDIAEVQIKQFGYEPVIDFTEAELTVPSYAIPEEAYVDVEAIANVPFEVIIPEEAKAWLTYDKKNQDEPYMYIPSTTIPRKQKFRFKFATYSDFVADRIAEIQFKQTASGVTRTEGTTILLDKTVKIIQEKAPVIIPSREGDSLAVLAIARNLNANMEIVASRPITHWSSVLVEERTYDYKNPITGFEKKDSTELRVVGFSVAMLDTKESLPYQVQYLTELETFAAIGNTNAFLKSIPLGPEITKCTKLRSLNLLGYGISSLPAEMATMPALEELELHGNCILDLNTIKNVLLGLKDHLKALNLGNNRISGSVMNLSELPKGHTLNSIGMGGNLANYEWLFTQMSELEELSLSYNYFYGDIPDFGSRRDILPKAKLVSLNLNRLTGKVPEWVLAHKYLACWNPFILLFNQEGYDNNGIIAGFSNAPTTFSQFPYEYNRECPDDDEEATAFALKLPELTQAELDVVPLHGYWRYYRMLNKKWNLKYNETNNVH